MKQEKAIQSFTRLGDEIRAFLQSPDQHPDWNTALKTAETQNAWFTRENIINSLKGIEFWLTKPALEAWLLNYPTLPKENTRPIHIGVIMAGNIPLVGFHDLLCVLITGNIIDAKLSSSDSILMKFLTQRLIAIEPELQHYINFIEKLGSADAVIATGSNNTARHFEYYFRNVPHIIRRNRNGVAVLDGTETPDEIGKLGEDIFSYFGLGCRNISKVYIPQDYKLDNLFGGIEKFSPVANHNKYANNYTYNRTIFLMAGKVFLDNNFFCIIEDTVIPSPIAVLHYERYSNLNTLGSALTAQKEAIQCIAATERVARVLGQTEIPVVGLGKTQLPGLMDYADGVDVIKFILEQGK